MVALGPLFAGFALLEKAVLRGLGRRGIRMRGLSGLDQDACNRMRCQPVHQSHYLAEYKPSISSVCGGTLRAQTEQVFFLANKKGNRAPTVTSGGLRSWFLGLEISADAARASSCWS